MQVTNPAEQSPRRGALHDAIRAGHDQALATFWREVEASESPHWPWSVMTKSYAVASR